jgi:hypothetical protein
VLTTSLTRRANQVKEQYAPHLDGPHPAPAACKDKLPDDAERLSRSLVKCAGHLTSYPISIDVEKLGANLNHSQIEALFELMAARRVYVPVLATRAIDLDAFPRRAGVLARFVRVARLNVSDVNDKLQAFAKTLGLSTPELA